MVSTLAKVNSPAFFAKHLREHADQYFPELGGIPASTRLVREEIRPVSALYEFVVRAADREVSIIVKVPLLTDRSIAKRGGADWSTERPQLVPISDRSTSHVLEHAALSAIDEHFQLLGDPRFGTIRVLALLPERGALIMERVHEPNLRMLLMRPTRWHSRRSDDALNTAFHNAGAWLRRYHSIYKQDYVTPRHTQRTDFIGFVGELTEYLGRELEEVNLFQEIAGTIEARAKETLPQSLPLGLSHGDYALRNILVGRSGRVTVCDTRARWQTAIYEDLGYFLVSLKGSWPQVYSQGLAFHPRILAQYERTFLAGYFGKADVPRGAVRLYEIMAMLDKQAWVTSLRAGAATVKSRLMYSTKLALMSRFFRNGIRTALSPDVFP